MPKMSSGYTTSFKEIASLHDEEVDAMTELYLSYYDGADAALVKSDLKRKTEVLQLLYHGELVGFSTFELYEHIWNNDAIRVVYSGDTVVRREHWGQQALAFAWIRYIGRLKQEQPRRRIYWFLIVKGHRTFKYLPAFTKSFYPHWSIDRSDLKTLLDHLAREKFGEYYDADSGIISFGTSHGHLKEGYAYPRENEKSKPSVQYFLQRNPGYFKGEELACICEFDDANLKPFTRRVLQDCNTEHNI